MGKKNLGNKGEEVARRYLERQGYNIVARNYALPGLGEIDIVARAPRGELVFAEVKTMRQGELLPEDNLTQAKLRKMRTAASGFLAKNPTLAGPAGWRLDVLAVDLPVSDGVEASLRHYENVS